MTSLPTDLALLEKKILYQFKNRSLLELAVTHRSYINENQDRQQHNERLEFLGDAVLELVVTQHLYTQMPDTPEGKLTSIRSALVRKENLNTIAQNLQLGDFLLLSKGEDLGGGRNNAYILANTIEALIGALYLDGQYTVAQKFIQNFVLPQLKIILQKKLYRDAKSFLQETAQEKLQITPHYGILSETGPDHDKTFKAGVFFDEELQASGTGSSKQAAENMAAQKALEKLQW